MSHESGAEERRTIRGRLRAIWEADRAGSLLDGADAQMARLMHEHPQWQDRWERADVMSDEEFMAGQVNPSLHLVAHEIALNQINGELPAAREIYDSLVARGIDSHEAIHRIGSLAMEEVYEVLKNQRPSDPARYERKLRALLSPARPKRRHRPRKR